MSKLPKPRKLKRYPGMCRVCRSPLSLEDKAFWEDLCSPCHHKSNAEAAEILWKFIQQNNIQFRDDKAEDR